MGDGQIEAAPRRLQGQPARNIHGRRMRIDVSEAPKEKILVSRQQPLQIRPVSGEEMKFQQRPKQGSAVPEIRSVVQEGLLVFVAGIAFALIANFISPSGLTLRRDYFLTRTRSPESGLALRPARSTGGTLAAALSPRADCGSAEIPRAPTGRKQSGRGPIP